MKTISIISQKGGAGKTTLALNLAGAAEAFGHRCVVIDLDPQASAKGWHDHRQKESPVVISAQASRIKDVLETGIARSQAHSVTDGRRSYPDVVFGNRSPLLFHAVLEPSILAGPH